MALAKERSIPHESYLMNSLNNHLSPESPYSSPEEFETFSPNGAGSFRAGNDPSEDGQSVINFSGFLANTDQPLLSFDPKEELYISTSDRSNHCEYQNPRFGSDYGWLYSESTVTTDQSFEESRTQESAGFNKRPNMGESTQAVKKQCSNINGATNGKKPKVQKPSASKDPQSIAAKNRRERISERLKVLQELVPNGTKVDMVTMLEKAIGYVKFLQLQVKVLATDEFWPVQGGKAPDISQVREAIDAILSSSQKERNSSSK